MEEVKIWHYLIQVANGLLFLHNKGICHNFLTPSGIFINDQRKVKISNLGKCVESIDFSGDVYQLGLILYDLCTSKINFKQENEDFYPSIKSFKFDLQTF